MHDYHKLIVWQRSFEFAKLVYLKTKGFPREELCGVTSQLRRAATSVAANIVEGRGKNSEKEFCRFLYISNGSLNECEFFLELSYSLSYLEKESFELLVSKKREVGYLLNQLIKRLS